MHRNHAELLGVPEMEEKQKNKRYVLRKLFFASLYLSTFTFGGGYKIANFNTVLKMKGGQKGVSNDLTLNADFSLQNNQSIIRKMQEGSSQATAGTKSIAINFTASYVLSKRITLQAYFDHQINKPLISSSAYPTTNSNYGVSVNLSLAQ